MRDVDDKTPLKPLLQLCYAFSTNGKIAPEHIASLRRHKEVTEEFRVAEHPTDNVYLEDISSERPSRKAVARELYLRCEPAFAKVDGFLTALSQEL
jgi:hypothetical protein